MSDISYVNKKKTDIRDVLIVYPFTNVNPYSNFPPIAAEYLQAGIAAAGRNVTLLDMRFEKDIGDHLEKADLVCLYGFFEDCSIFGKWNNHVISEVLDQVPKDTPIVAGGTGFANPAEALNTYPKIDVVIRGLPDTPIRELLEAGSPESVRNLVYRRGTELMQNPTVVHPLSDDIYPRRTLRNPKYDYRLIGIPVDVVRAAIGCNYKCRFCYQYGKDTEGNFLRWQGRSPQSQFRELSEIEAPIVLWVDDDMTTDMKALDEMADLLIQNNVRKILIGTGRVDHILESDVARLRKLERAGLLALAFGVESLKEATLKFYRKVQTMEETEQAMRMMNGTNIMLVCNFLLGSPGETREDMMEFLEFGRRWEVDTLVTNRLRVPEGSELHRLIHDPKTGREMPGMERVQADELGQIKDMIKFGQRTPFRLALTLLKMFRHRGLFIDPLYFGCSLLETVTRHTWLEKTGVMPALLYIPKKVALLGVFRAFTRFAAVVATPPMRIINRLFEVIDRRLHISTTVLPAIFRFYNRRWRDVLRQRAQLVRDRASASR
ncbi:MAG TPA: radical SAM protein [Nitrospiraceae bacterium]|nr:radical SAM protein [Nitrospiraceae bacterium]